VFATNVFTQTSNFSIRDSINSVFSELNQSYINTGIFYEKASPTLNWGMFAGKNDSSTHLHT
jgi:hypothetical protein